MVPRSDKLFEGQLTQLTVVALVEIVLVNELRGDRQVFEILAVHVVFLRLDLGEA